MKAMIIRAYGGPQLLEEAEIPDPVPLESQVLIKIVCAGVNPIDWKTREGQLAEAFPYELPIVLGVDASGTIGAVGKNVTDFAVGDRVYVACPNDEGLKGSYSELMVCDSRSVAMMPSNLAFVEAAAVPLTALTAWQALFDFSNLDSGETVLILGGSGGVGSFAIQFANCAKATTFATASRVNHGYVKALGASLAIDYRSEDVASIVKTKHPRGVDVVLDTVGGEAQAAAFPALREGGVLVSTVEPPDPKLAEKYGVRADDIVFSADGRQLYEISKLLQDRSIRLPAIKELPLSEAARAHVASRARHIRGKLVLRVREE